MSEEEIGGIITIGSFILGLIVWIYSKTAQPASEAVKRGQAASASGSGNKTKQVQKLVELGDVQFARGKVVEALGSFRRAFELSKGLNEPALEMMCAFRYAGQHRYLGQTERAVKVYAEVTELGENLGNVVYQMNSLYQIARTFAEVDRFQTAIEYFQQALELAENNNAPEMRAAVLNDLSEQLIVAGEAEAAVGNLQRVIKINESANYDSASTNKMYNLFNLAFAYATLGKINQARQLMKETKFSRLTKAKHDDYILIDWLYTRARVFQKLGNIKDAQGSCRQAVVIINRNGYENLLGHANYYLGMLELEKWKRGKTPEHFLKHALKIAEKYGDVHFEAKSLVGLGRFYVKSGKRDKAREHLSKALPVLDRMQSAHGDNVRSLLATL